MSPGKKMTADMENGPNDDIIEGTDNELDGFGIEGEESAEDEEETADDADDMSVLDEMDE